MNDQPEKRQVRRLRWIAAVFLLLAAILMAPFLLTRQLVCLALGQVFPASYLSVGSAVLSLSGTLVLHDLSASSPAGGKHAFALDGLTAVGSVESQLKPWALAALKVREGVLLWATLRYNDHALNRLDATWRLDGQTLMIERVAAEIFDGHISGLLDWDLG
jgi:hypothetical protein